MWITTIRPRRMALGLLVAATLVVTGGVAPAQARAWLKDSQVCQVSDARIKENSGMSRSTYPRRVWFAHNDSGGGPQFFALDSSCDTVAVFDVPGAPSSDWEDMAVGPGHTLWFGDIGGNNPRNKVNVVKVHEPKKLRSRDLHHTSYALSYPDGKHNAEGMMIRPSTGRLYVITKATSGAGIYRAPKTLDPDHTNKLTRIANAPSTVTGADFSMTGDRFVLRTYTRIYVYREIGGHAVTRRVPKGHTGGEAVMFTRHRSLLLGAEGVDQWVWKMR